MARKKNKFPVWLPCWSTSMEQIADKDVFTCPESDIHNAKLVSTWFEGKMVYPK